MSIALGKEIANRLIKSGQYTAENIYKLLYKMPIVLHEDVDPLDIFHDPEMERAKPVFEAADIILHDDTTQVKLVMNDGHLYTLNGTKVGEYHRWIDPHIPAKFTRDGSVIHPSDKLPIIEFMLYEDKKDVHNLDDTLIYREYEYDLGMAKLVRTKRVIYIH